VGWGGSVGKVSTEAIRSFTLFLTTSSLWTNYFIAFAFARGLAQWVCRGKKDKEEKSLYVVGKNSGTAATKLGFGRKTRKQGENTSNHQ
jgi:hypothetical protein